MRPRTTPLPPASPGDGPVRPRELQDGHPRREHSDGSRPGQNGRRLPQEAARALAEIATDLLSVMQPSVMLLSVMLPSIMLPSAMQPSDLHPWQSIATDLHDRIIEAYESPPRRPARRLSRWRPGGGSFLRAED